MKARIQYALFVSSLIILSLPAHAGVVHKQTKPQAKAAVQSAKDKQIAALEAEVQQLKANLLRAQAKIDSLETPSVAASKNAGSDSAPIPEISNVIARSFPGGDNQGDPIWVITFEIKNIGKADVAIPKVYVSCSDNNIGIANPYLGDKGMTVVNPALIHPGQDIHVKYAWIAVTPTESVRTITIDLGSISVVEPVTLDPATN